MYPLSLYSLLVCSSMEWLFGPRKTLQDRYQEIEKDLKRQERRIRSEEERALDEANDLRAETKNELRRNNEHRSRQLAHESVTQARSADQFRADRLHVSNLRKQAVRSRTRENVMTQQHKIEDLTARQAYREQARERVLQERARAMGVDPDAVTSGSRFVANNQMINKHFDNAKEALHKVNEDGELSDDDVDVDPEVDNMMQELWDVIELEGKEDAVTQQHHLLRAQKKSKSKRPFVISSHTY